MNKSILLIITLIFLLIACRESTYESYFDGEKTGNEGKSINQIVLDTLFFDDFNSSYDGFLTTDDHKLLYIDRRFGWIYEFDTLANLIKRNLGFGGGPNELNTGYIDGYLRLKNNNHLFFGPSFDIHIHDSAFLRISESTIKVTGNPNVREVRDSKNPDPSEFMLYSPTYPNLILKEDSRGNVFLPIYSNEKNFNPYSHDYYESARILAKMDLSTITVTEVLGRISPTFQEYKYIPQHRFIFYEIDSEGNFYISYEVDPLIYVYDSDFNLQRKFGIEGKRMNVNYLEIKNTKEFLEAYREDRPKRGYYHHLKYFEDSDMLIRSYTRGNPEIDDGLQIYRGNDLIADLSVPENFKVIGYIAPYFYSEMIIDEELSDLRVYRFKIPE